MEPYSLDPNRPLIILIGTLDSDGILSTIKAGPHQYKLKRLTSNEDNWDSIVDLFKKFKVKCVLLKLGASSFQFFQNTRYSQHLDRLLTAVASVPHAIYAHKELIDPDYSILSMQLPSPEEIQAVRDAVDAHHLNFILYDSNAELNVVASTFISDVSDNLLFRVYVPEGRLWAAETDKLLQLFRDYLSKVGHFDIRLDRRRTDRGTIFEFFGSEQAAGNSQPVLVNEFNEFTRFLDLTIQDPASAQALLESKSIDRQELNLILSRYAKEARRLQVDLRHEREQKLLSIRQQLESELVDFVPHDVSQAVIDSLVDATVPQVMSLSASQPRLWLDGATTPPRAITSTQPSQVINIVNSVVAQHVHGHIALAPEARQLLEEINIHGGEHKTELSTAVTELGDPLAPESDRLLAKQRLRTFLSKAADKLSDVALGVLQRYIEHQAGL